MSVVRKIAFTILLFFWLMLMTALLTEYWEPVRVMIYTGILFWISRGVRFAIETIENRGDDNEEEF